MHYLNDEKVLLLNQDRKPGEHAVNVFGEVNPRSTLLYVSEFCVQYVTPSPYNSDEVTLNEVSNGNQYVLKKVTLHKSAVALLANFSK